MTVITEVKTTLLGQVVVLENLGRSRLVEKVEGTHVYFWHELEDDNPKTEVWQVRAKEFHDWLGKISWYGPWRKYVFMPTYTSHGEHGLYVSKTVFEEVCMREISYFIEKLTALQRQKWRKGKVE